MARQPKLWLRKQTGWWMTTLHGRQHKLSKDKAEAQKAFHTLMLKDEPPPVHSRGRPTFRELADRFLDHSHEVNSKSAFDSHRHYLQSFADIVKQKRAPDLKGEDVTRWLKANPQWGQSTRSLAIQAVKACLNWGVTEGIIAEHPLIKVKQGRIKRRERILTDEERERILKRIEGSAFADFWFILEQTGMRPFSEAAKITADMVDWEKGTITFKDHKNARHGKARVVFLPPPALERLKALAAARPEGLLLRTRFGEPFTKNSTYKWAKVFERELGIKGFTIYAIRHGFATKAIERGVPLPVVAELMGNSVRIVLESYSHINQRHDALREAAAKAVT